MSATQRTKGAAAERELCHLPSEGLAVRYGVTQRGMLQKLIADTERALLATLSRDQQADYYEARPKTVTL